MTAVRASGSPMNVLLLGVGAVGSVLARHLAAHRSVGRLTLADFDTTRAARLREEIAAAHPGLADRLRVEAVDASDPAAWRAPAGIRGWFSAPSSPASTAR